MIPARELGELLKLDDDAFVNTHEAAAVVGYQSNTLLWYRKRNPQRSPKYYRIGPRMIRYRMGDLRAYRNGDPNACHVPPTVSEG